MSVDLAIGLLACLGWATILLHAHFSPSTRIWPPRHPTWITVVWAWGLTTLIYVSIVRLGDWDSAKQSLPPFVHIFGFGLAIAGSLYHSWATSALGLKATSGWPEGGSYPVARCTKGPYKHVAHPQYIGQSLSFVGLAIVGGSLSGALVAAVGCATLALASYIEHQHLV